MGPVTTRAGLFDDLGLFVGPDGSKQPQDLGINANMGLRVSRNWGVPLVDRYGLGAQLGIGRNMSDAAVHVIGQIEGTSRRTQTFVTAGLFQNAVRRVSWGLAHDWQFQRYYDDFSLGQVRGSAGYALTSREQVGVWFTKGVTGDDGCMADAPVRLDPIGQVNVFSQHTWASGTDTSVWVGAANGHNNVVWVLPDGQRHNRVLVCGSELHVPLDERFAITGAANFITPTATGTVDAYRGRPAAVGPPGQPDNALERNRLKGVAPRPIPQWRKGPARVRVRVPQALERLPDVLGPGAIG